MMTNNRRPTLSLLLGLLLLPIAAPGCGGGSGGGGETENFGVVERFADEGREHVPDSVVPTYATDPPTSGPHYDVPTAPGFYTVAPRPGHLVHSLEHGIVVIYYDPARLPAADRDRLRALTEQYPGAFDGVVAVPRDDPTSPLLLTAWRARLRLPGYDVARLDAFFDEFRGRGPEHPVR